MRSNKHPVNVLLKSGKAVRVSSARAEELFDRGEAQHYISKTVFRAMQLGIEVRDPLTRDLDNRLQDQIVIAREKKAKRKARKEKELATHEAHVEETLPS